MKNQREIYEALLAGHKLQIKGDLFGNFVYMVDGNVINQYGDLSIYAFTRPEDWEIVKEPEVYEVEVEWERSHCGRYIYPTDIELDFVWSKLNGKRTKLRIEVIK